MSHSITLTVSAPTNDEWRFSLVGTDIELPDLSAITLDTDSSGDAAAESACNALRKHGIAVTIISLHNWAGVEFDRYEAE